MRTLRSRRAIALLALGTAAGIAAALAAPAGATPAPPTGQAAPATPAPRATTAAQDPAAQTGQPGQVTLATNPVPGSWLVTLRSPAAPADVLGLALGLAQRYAGSVQRVYGSALRGFAVRMDEAAARRLATDPQVAAVEQDARVRTTGSQDTTGGNWGLDRVDQRTLPLDNTYGYPSTGSGVTAYVIDTGIRTTHTDFGGRASVGFDNVGDGRDGQDCDGHGTHVAGILGGGTYGVAKGVRLVAVRTLGCSGEGTLGGVVGAVDWVTAHAAKPAVANLSLSLDGPSTLLDSAIRSSITAGVTYAVAAGNSAGDACTYSPARAPDAITVGASTPGDARAGFSNTGGCLDLFAPGDGVLSDYAGSDTATATIAGTSMAAPHAAGAAALVLAATPGASPAAVRTALVGSATSGVLTGVPPNTVNRLLYVAAQPDPGGTPTPTPSPGAPAGGWPGMNPTASPTSPAPLVNDTDLPIPDRGTVLSAITVTGRPGRASAALAVSVQVVHPYRGDLAVDLLAPDGRVYRVKAPSTLDRGANLDLTVAVNASASPASGTWRLRVRDVYAGDTGFLDRWGLS